MAIKGTEPDITNAKPRSGERRAPRKPDPTPDSAEIAPPREEKAQPKLARWQPPAIVKVTTQMTVEHRQLMDRLEKTTGNRMWEIIRDAIEKTHRADLKEMREEEG